MPRINSDPRISRANTWYGSCTAAFQRSLYNAFGDIRVTQYFASYFFLTLRPVGFLTEDAAVTTISHHFITSTQKNFATYISILLQIVRDTLNDDIRFKSWMKCMCNNIPIEAHRREVTAKLANYAPYNWPERKLNVHQ